MSTLPWWDSPWLVTTLRLSRMASKMQSTFDRGFVQDRTLKKGIQKWVTSQTCHTQNSSIQIGHCSKQKMENLKLRFFTSFRMTDMDSSSRIANQNDNDGDPSLALRMIRIIWKKIFRPGCLKNKFQTYFKVHNCSKKWALDDICDYLCQDSIIVQYAYEYSIKWGKNQCYRLFWNKFRMTELGSRNKFGMTKVCSEWHGYSTIVTWTYTLQFLSIQWKTLWHKLKT